MVSGGKREGAGRKKSEPTKRMSIPLGLVSDIEQLIIDYKAEKTKPLSKLLIEFVEMFPDYLDNTEVLAPVGLLFDDWEDVKLFPRTERKIILKMMQKT